MGFEKGSREFDGGMDATFFVTEKGGAKKVSALMLAACTTMARLASRRKLLVRPAPAGLTRRTCGAPLRALASPKSYDGGSQGAEGLNQERSRAFPFAPRGGGAHHCYVP